MSIEAFYPSPTSTASNRKMALRIPPPLHRSTLRPYLAEFIGTLLLILIGDGVVAQALLTNFHYANFLSVNLAWASAVSLSCYIGASVNPAITLASAIVRPSKQQWQQLPGKITAQFAGAFVGAALVYLQYASAIATWDPEYTVPGGSILSPQGHHSAGILDLIGKLLLLSFWVRRLWLWGFMLLLMRGMGGSRRRSLGCLG
jgi:aquaglyceroporin related protein